MKNKDLWHRLTGEQMFSSTVNPYRDYVHFINASYGLRAIRAIRLDFYCPFGKQPKILFKISPFNKQELKDIFRNFFYDTSDLISLGGLLFQIALNKQSLEKIFAIFDVLNAQNEHEAFPEILKSELLNIDNFKTDNRLAKHLFKYIQLSASMEKTADEACWKL